MLDTAEKGFGGLYATLIQEKHHSSSIADKRAKTLYNCHNATLRKETLGSLALELLSFRL
jgi:hypothetical protein